MKFDPPGIVYVIPSGPYYIYISSEEKKLTKKDWAEMSVRSQEVKLEKFSEHEANLAYIARQLNLILQNEVQMLPQNSPLLNEIQQLPATSNAPATQTVKDKKDVSSNKSPDIEYIGDVSPEIAKKAIDICMVALKGSVKIPEGKPSITVNGENLIITFPTEKIETAPGDVHMGADYSAKVTLDMKTWKIINVLVGS